MDKFLPEEWRNAPFGTVLAWVGSVFIAIATGWTIFGAVVSYVVSASANDIFDGMLKSRGITAQSFKDLQSAAIELKADVGSIKANMNSINNTLTLNAVRAEAAETDRQELKEQVGKLVDKLIQE